jgi:hypothetical protein
MLAPAYAWRHFSRGGPQSVRPTPGGLHGRTGDRCGFRGAKVLPWRYAPGRKASPNLTLHPLHSLLWLPWVFSNLGSLFCAQSELPLTDTVGHGFGRAEAAALVECRPAGRACESPCIGWHRERDWNRQASAVRHRVTDLGRLIPEGGSCRSMSVGTGPELG